MSLVSILGLRLSIGICNSFAFSSTRLSACSFVIVGDELHDEGRQSMSGSNPNQWLNKWLCNYHKQCGWLDEAAKVIILDSRTN